MMATRDRIVPPSVRRPVAVAERAGAATISPFEHLGFQFTFAWGVLAAVPHTVRTYRRQITRTLVDLTWGSGGIVVGGGMIVVLLFLGVATGASVGIEGFSALDLVGMGPLTGFISAYTSTREMAPLIVAIGFAAQAGCRITAEIGAMRISEEIDALEASGIRSIPFVVTTRVIAGVITIIPLYLMTLVLNYLSCAFVVEWVNGQAAGTYAHYFDAFLRPGDMAASLLKAVVFITVIIMIHAYFGYFASGGPEGVGRAAGRAVRASLIVIVLLDMALTIVFWGSDTGIRISG